MDIGTGIFLGSVIIGAALLFHATKDRWRWKRIFLWVFGSVAGLGGIVALSIYGTGIWENRPPGKQDAFGDVKLGFSKDEVLFRKGKPTSDNDDRWTYELSLT